MTHWKTAAPGAAFALALSVAVGQAEPEIRGTQVFFEVQAVQDLIEKLDLWLDTHSDLPRAERPLARIAFVPAGAEVLYDGQMTQIGNTMRGLYDAETAAIYLQRPWFGDTARDRSVLLHEMVHHRQAGAQHWYCPQAMEWDAYRLQEDYLNAQGEASGFNWAWILLGSSCATRDHHPD